MKSKEALEKIGNYPIGNFGIFTIYDLFKEDFDLIVQDLERLEKLEKFIELLKDKIQVYADYLEFYSEGITKEEYKIYKEMLDDDK